MTAATATATATAKDATTRGSYASIPSTTPGNTTNGEEVMEVDEEAAEETIGLMNHDHNGDPPSRSRRQTRSRSHSHSHSQSRPRRGRDGRPRRPVHQVQYPNNAPGAGAGASLAGLAPHSSVMLRLTCMSVLTLVILSAVGLLTFLEESVWAPTYQFIPATGDEQDDDDVRHNIQNLDAGAATKVEEPNQTSSSTSTSNSSLDTLPSANTGSSSTGTWEDSSLDPEALKQLWRQAGLSSDPTVRPRTPHTVHYDPQVANDLGHPFDFSTPTSTTTTTWGVPSMFGADSTTPGLGYLKSPHLVNHQLVFLSQGDVFVTSVPPPNTEGRTLSATRLTTTVGNVLDPKLHPQLRYLAYTATYSGRRDVYLLDLQRPGRPAIRLTYWDHRVGVSGLIGWLTDTSLVFRASSNEVSLPDFRLYVLHLDNSNGMQENEEETGNPHSRKRSMEEGLNKEGEEDSLLGTTTGTEEVPPPTTPRTNPRPSNTTASSSSSSSSSSTQSKPLSVFQIDPVPLSQAREAAMVDGCWYFVRYSQSSHTIRYVGGTAEQLYRYCQGDDHTTKVPRQDAYRGTSKSPQYSPHFDDIDDAPYLFFLSDRMGGLEDGPSKPDRMNVWAMKISASSSNRTTTSAKDEDDALPTPHDLIQITDTACDFEGRTIQEYSIDAHTGDIVLRIGADLYWMTAATIRDKLVTAAKRSSSRRRRRRLQRRQQRLEEDDEPLFGGDSTATTVESNNSNETLLSSDEPVDESLVVDQDTATVSKGNPDSALPARPNVDLDEDSAPITIGDDEMDSNETTIVPALATGVDDDDDLSDILDDFMDGNETNVTMATEMEEPGSPVYYHFDSPGMESRFAQDAQDHITGRSEELARLPIVVHSDFHTHQERLIPVDLLDHMTSADVYETTVGSIHFIMTLRGQLWVAPVIEDGLPAYKGAGRNLPERRYRVAPGATMGGVVRILGVRHVPNPVEDEISERRLAIILATDPLTSTAEHAFYLIETHSSATPLFLDLDRLPKPFLGGHLSGGSTKEGGLGSVVDDSWTISPCGRRMAWTNKDGQIIVMNLPHYQNLPEGAVPQTTVLPKENEAGEPMMGDDEADLTFSPGGRYLAINHNARNQFSIISIVDLGDPRGDDEVADITIGRIVQATPSRFNSASPYWGKSSTDRHVQQRESTVAKLLGDEPSEDVSTTLFFLSDRDIKSDVQSPWGTRQPMPHFKKQRALYALPLFPQNATLMETIEGHFSTGGASELKAPTILARQEALKKALKDTSSRRRRLSKTWHTLTGAYGLADDSFSARSQKLNDRYMEEEEDTDNSTTDDDGKSPSTNDNLSDDDTLRLATFPQDMDINLGPLSDHELKFARNAYRMANIPEANYGGILSQTPDDGSFVLSAIEDEKAALLVFLADGYPSDQYTPKRFSPTSRKLTSYGRSTSGAYLYFGFAPDGQHRVVPNSASGLAELLMDSDLDENIVSSSGLHLSVWPSLEYRQLYDDAWRMLRDYFYDPDMTGIDWPAVHERYLPLVSRCAKREELDDVLIQMASELSALHVFVYGGEYDSPITTREGSEANQIGSLGAVLKRTPEWHGYRVMSIPESDPDFSVIDQENQIYSPLSEMTLKLSGQKGLQIGDVIVSVNGESVMAVPDIHLLLRGMAGHSVRLDVLRLASGEGAGQGNNGEATVEPVIAVPIRPMEADDLVYRAWEWRTRQLAEKLAQESDFSVGYVHLQDMSGPQAEDAFARGLFPNYHKEAFILDVRHNRGGNIDSWILDVLQRKPWMYWQSRDYDVNNGGLGWDEQFAFRGHIVVLVDEMTSSDGEGVSRGISELGLGRLIGTRTWGGGIWLSSDNHLVDGGIATAPEIGTYNDNFGWGLGIEQMGVEPDIVVDNDPKKSYEGVDTQLERAIAELKKWLEAEPIVTPKPPQQKKDMTMGERECRASKRNTTD